MPERSNSKVWIDDDIIINMKKGVLILCSLAGFAALVLSPNTALAQTEKIISFKSDVTITKENKAVVTETIDYDFGNLQRHGIYRDIPIDYNDGQGNSYHLVAQHKGTVDENNNGVKASTSTTSGNYRIKIGDPDKYITGRHVYKITYELWPVISEKSGTGFLNLDLLGTGWLVPVDNFEGRVRLEGQQIGNAICYIGVQGSTQQCTVANEGNDIVLTANGLVAGQGVTINGDINSGYVSNYLIPNKARPLTKDDYIGMAIFGSIALGAVSVGVVFAMRALRKKRRKSSQTVVAEYEPPSNMTLPEIGYIQDDIASSREITAMLIDMAVKGYIKIEQTRKKGFLKSAKYSLHKLKPADGLDSNYQKLHSAIFTDSSATAVAVDDLNKSTMASTLLSIQKDVKNSLTNKGFYGKFSSEPNIIEKMLDSGSISDEGAKMWAKVEGFKLYLSVVEKDRLKFSDAPERTPELFSKMLPFAVALGVEKEWAKQFEGIDISKSTSSWYTGNYVAFSAVNLTNDLSSSFAPVVSSNSSVSSSGGSSGGGVGGGGGGSW